MKHRRKIITTGALWSEKLASINHAAERLYWRIYMASDNYGVMSGKAWDVCQQATPGVAGYNRETVLQSIDALVGIGLLERWEVDGAAFIYVIGHDEHQSADFIRKRGRSRRTPMPPSQLAVLSTPPSSVRAAKGSEGQRTGADTEPTIRAAKGSEGQNPSADAVVCPSGAKGTLSTTTSTSTTTKTCPPPSEKSAVVEMPPSTKSIDGQIRRAQGELQSHATWVILSMIARRNAASEREMTPAAELEKFWKPALVLLADHGPLRLREALNLAAGANASAIQYVGTICGRMREQHIAATIDNPDLAGSDYANFQPKVVDAGEVA